MPGLVRWSEGVYTQGVELRYRLGRVVASIGGGFFG